MLFQLQQKQAEDWYKNATKEELNELKDKKITQHKQDKSANPQLNDKDIHVYYEDNQWKIKLMVLNKLAKPLIKRRCYEACSKHR